MVKTLSFCCRVMGSVPVWGTKIPHALRLGEKKVKKNLLKKE